MNVHIGTNTNVKLISQRKHESVWQYTLIFFVVSFIGWAAETLYFLRVGAPSDRGFLFLPFCTVYGFCFIAAKLILGVPDGGAFGNLYDKLTDREKRKLSVCIVARLLCIGLYFLCASFLAAFAELITGLFFDRIFGVRLWDYSGFDYNVFGYACPRFAVLFGGLITIGMLFLQNPLRNYTASFGRNELIVLDCVLLIAVTVDFVCNAVFAVVTGGHFTVFGWHV